MQATESGKRHRRRPGWRRATRDGGTPKRAVRAELVCLPPRASGLTPRPSLSRGKGRPRGQVIVPMILKAIQRDQGSWMGAAVVGKSSLHHSKSFQQLRGSTTPRVARCGLKPENYLCAPIGGCMPRTPRSSCFNVPVCLYFFSVVSPDAC